MKFIVVAVLAFAAVAASAPAESEPVKILKSNFDQQPDGAFSHSFESDDGTKQEVTGELKEVFDEEKKSHVVVITRGSYEYIDNAGQHHVVTYVADEAGFHPASDDLPVAPVARR